MKNNETLLEKRAKKLFEYLDPDGVRRAKLPRPFMAEVTGSPDSGKTTVLKILDDFFRRQKDEGQERRIWIPLEGAEKIRNIPRTTHHYSIAVSTYTLQILLEHSYSIEYDMILFDRCVYDAWCWLEYRRRQKELTQERSDYMTSFFTDSSWRKNIDVCFFIMCDPKVAYQRNRKHSLTKKAGRYTTLKAIGELYDIFYDGYTHFKEQGDPVVLIDTTRLTPKQVAEKVLIHSIKAFERRFKESK